MFPSIPPPPEPPRVDRRRSEDTGHGALVLILALLLVGTQVPDFVLAAAIGCLVSFVAAAIWQVQTLRAWLRAQQTDDPVRSDEVLDNHPASGVDSPPSLPEDPGDH